MSVPRILCFLEIDGTFNGNNFEKMTDQELDGLKGSSPEKENGMDVPSFQGLSPNDQNSPEKMKNTLAMFKNKMKDGKRAIVRLKRQQEDAQLDVIISDLMLLESHLRKEQSQILSQLASRDVTISVQRQEIERLRRDNRRLISRLKKITEGRDSREDKPSVETNNEKDDLKSTGKKSSKAFSKRPQESYQSLTNRPFVKHSVMTSLTSQFYEKSALQFTDENGKIVDRVMHKPPIAEKPKIGVTGATHRPLAAIVRSQNGQCNIVSTISRLLDEESDQGITGSSGSSEPSSPEATLKPTTPRVIRLARQYEKGLIMANGSSASGSSSSESGRSGDEQSVKTMIMDEHEVTSGYNSDAISDQDHDYENIVFFKGKAESGADDGNQEYSKHFEDDDDNYVILRAVRDDHDNSVLIEDPEDQHIYSNIEYGPREELEKSDVEFSPEELAKEALLKQLLETNLDSSESPAESSELSESPKRAKNVPRSRHNINLVMGSEESRLMDNFEEFTLDSLDLEDLNGDELKGKENLPLLHHRHSGDGAEAKNPASKEQKEVKNLMAGQGGYEKFLEVTGLSQKSILTPSRMFSNHRSVLKPRDIKHRDKLRAAFTSLSTLEEVTTPSGTSGTSATTSQSQNASSQRYWREPYL